MSGALERGRDSNNGVAGLYEDESSTHPPRHVVAIEAVGQGSGSEEMRTTLIYFPTIDFQ